MSKRRAPSQLGPTASMAPKKKTTAPCGDSERPQALKKRFFEKDLTKLDKLEVDREREHTGAMVCCKANKTREKPPPRFAERAGPCGAPRWTHELARNAHMVLTKTHTKYGIQQMLDIVIATYEKNDGCFTRDLVFLEVASGWGETSFWVKEFGGSGQEFDSQTRHEDENLNQLVGLFLLFYWVFSFFYCLF